MNNKKHNGQQVGYRRVSSVDQSTARQLDGLTFDIEFEDKASGKDTNRPQLDALLKHIRAGDTVWVHSIDRLARSLSDLLKLVQVITKEKGASLRFVKENLTFTGGAASAMDELMLSMLGAVAQFERSMIRERQAEGIAKAKQAGAYRGGKPKLTEAQAAEMVAMVLAGESKASAAKKFGISRETLYTYLGAAAQKASATA